MQTEISQWLDSLNVQYHEVDKGILTKNNVFIKIFDYKEEHQHADMLKYREQNIHSVFFLPDEWLNRNQQCKNYLKSILGICNRKIFGRECTVYEVDKKTAREFIDNYHIQGSNSLGLVYFGISYKDELLGVMSLGRHTRQNVSINIVVLDRLCFKDGVQVIGGASKLFNVAKKWADTRSYHEILSFSDNRWSKGNVYEKMGFGLNKEYGADYFYIDAGEKRYTKQSQKKDLVNCPAGLTEMQWATQRGLRKILDCGKKRWTYELIDINNLTPKQKLSYTTAQKHSTGFFHHYHIRGYFKSEKNKRPVYFGSSYELRCMFLYELDASIKSYRRHRAIIINGKARSPDLLVEYVDGGLGIIEIKPKNRLSESDVVDQINDSQLFAQQNGYFFKVWTEDDSGLKNDYAIIKWAKEYLATHQNDTKYAELQQENSRLKAKKHYDEKVSQNKVDVHCLYCSAKEGTEVIHSVLRVNYDKNMKNNFEKYGHYICEKEGGHIAGSKPKTSLIKENPYAADGKKQCTGCKGIKLFEEFGLDKSRRDGYANNCKVCRAVKSKIKYQSKDFAESIK